MIAKQVAVIGDVHGCYKTLIALIDKIKSQFPEAQICIAGDLVDRGPDSASVVQYCIDNRIPVTKGNHEQMMYTDLDKTTEYPGTWKMNGGLQTLESYEEFPSRLQPHADWMRNLPVYIDFPNCRNENGDKLVVSHSSVQRYWAHNKVVDGAEDDVTWNRDTPEESIGYHQGIFNVFGHSPVKNGPQIGKFYANIDTGAVYKREGYGKLTSLVFPDMVVIKQDNIE